MLNSLRLVFINFHSTPLIVHLIGCPECPNFAFDQGNSNLPLSSSAHVIGQTCVTSSSSSPLTTMMTFRCLLIGQSLLLIHHHHFWSQISMIGPYHCIRNDQISWKQVWNRSNRISGGYVLIKTILAWWTAQIQSQIRLHVDSAAQNLIPRLAAWLSLAPTQLGSTQLGAARLGSSLMTWQVGPTMLTCQMTGRWHGMPTVHAGVMFTSWWRHPYSGLARGSGRVSPSGRRRRVWCVARVCARGQPPRRSVTARAAVSNIRFRRGFYQWLRLFLLYTVVWSKHNFDNFNF